MSNYPGYGSTVREYRDDPNHQEYRDQPFGAPGVNSFEDVFDQITQNIVKINKGASMIEKGAKLIGTDRDSDGQAGEKIHGVSQDTSKVVSNTSRLFQQLGRRKLDRTQRLQLEKVKNDFQESVQRFQTLQKKALEKAKTASRMEKPKPAPVSPWMDDEDDQALLVEDDRRRQQLMAQEQVIDDDLALIREREEQIRELEGDILDVNEIFRDLGAMIQEQGEQIDTIEANVEKAYTDVEQGTTQLQKASTYQKKSRKKMCCLVVILLVVVAVVAIIVVIAVKA